MMLTTGIGIALAGVAITAGQIWIAYAKLRVELIKPRLDTYRAFVAFLGKAMTNVTDINDPEVKAVFEMYPVIGFLSKRRRR